jgi:hypothetical protein
MPGASSIWELRPVLEADDFGEALTPELKEKERQLRKALESKRERRRR